MDDRIISSRTQFEGWLSVQILTLRLNGEDEERPPVFHPSGSAVLPYDPERRVAIIVQQTRAAILFTGSEPVTEAIAGVTEEDRHEDTAKREAEEEGGVRLRALERVGAVWMDPNSSTEQVHLFLAEYEAGDRVSEGGGLAEENEQVSVIERSLSELWHEVTSANVADAKTLLLLQALRLRRPELFGESAP